MTRTEISCAAAGKTARIRQATFPRTRLWPGMVRPPGGEDLSGMPSEQSLHDEDRGVVGESLLPRVLGERVEHGRDQVRGRRVLENPRDSGQPFQSELFAVGR